MDGDKWMSNPNDSIILLAFEKIVKRIIPNKHVGYWLLGLSLILAWNVTGFFSKLLYGEWIFEPQRVVIFTNLLFLLTLLSLRYLIKTFKHTYKAYGISNEAFEVLFSKVWWCLFTLLIGYQSWWFLKEYFYISLHPKVVGEPERFFRGANLGLPLLLYFTIVSTALFLMFVDLVAIGITSCILPRRIKKERVNIISEYKSGGNSKIGNLLMEYFKVYFTLLFLGTFARFPGIRNPTLQYYLIITVIAWLFGLCLFFYPMNTIKKQIYSIKLKILEEIEHELIKLKKDVEKKSKDSFNPFDSLDSLEFLFLKNLDKLNAEQISKMLFLLKLKDDYASLLEFPNNFRVWINVIFFGFLSPIVSNLAMILIERKIGLK